MSLIEHFMAIVNVKAPVIGACRSSVLYVPRRKKVAESVGPGFEIGKLNVETVVLKLSSDVPGSSGNAFAELSRVPWLMFCLNPIRMRMCERCDTITKEAIVVQARDSPPNHLQVQRTAAIRLPQVDASSSREP